MPCLGMPFGRGYSGKPFIVFIMAENKKSFIIYSDVIHTVSKLSNEKAGELFKHILSYVNNENPVTDDLLIEIAFEPIKQSLKRDLKKYEERANNSRENGSKGGRPKKEKHLNPENPVGFLETNSVILKPEKPVNANDIEMDIDIDNATYKKKKTEKKVIYPELEEFLNYAKTVTGFETKFETLKYSLTAKFETWKESGWKDGYGVKIINWKTKLRSTLPYLKNVYDGNDTTKKQFNARTADDSLDEAKRRILGDDYFEPSSEGRINFEDAGYEDV